METRSRKRAEGRAQRPPAGNNNSNKRPRLLVSTPLSSAHHRLRSATRTSASTPTPTQPQPRGSPSAVSRMESSASASRRDRDRDRRDRAKEDDQAAAMKRNAEEIENKGKQKEIERERGRERERSGRLSSSNDEDDDDDDDRDDDYEDDDDVEDGLGGLHRDLPSATSAALQGLLRKLGAGLGAGLDDLLPSSGRFKKIMSGLRAEGEIGRQIESLTQLCEILSMGTEDSLSTFSVDTFVPVLVGLLKCEANSDIMLLAARALTHLCDVLPSSCAAVVNYGAVPCFCARLLSIEYIDLAEQSLQALKKISHEHPTACLQSGALMAVLSYLEFFPTGVQRVAVSTAANICKQLPSDLLKFAMEAVPLLTNLIPCNDSKVVEHASVCLARITESIATSPKDLDELCEHGVVLKSAQLISVNNSGSASLSSSTYTGVIRLLSTCASGSAISAKALLENDISGTLRDILAGSGLVSRMPIPPSLNRPPEQLYEIVTLVNELLPSPPHGTISLPTSLSIGSNGPMRKQALGDSSGNLDETVPEISVREKLLSEKPGLLAQFGMDLFPLLVQVHGSSVNPPVRYKCLAAISKLLYFSTAEMLQSLLRVTNISSFLAGVLACKDPQVLVPALQIADILMQKLPGTFCKMFLKEGVVHAVDMLISSDPSSVSSLQTSALGKDQNVSVGVLPKTRRNRRQNGRLKSEASGLEEPKDSNAGIVGPPPYSGALEISTVKSGLRSSVGAYARWFRDTYFPADAGAVDAGATDSLCKLKSLCKKLNSDLLDPKGKSKGKRKGVVHVDGNSDQSLNVIADMLSELSEGDGVSTFEFVGSGIVASLLNYFAGGTICSESMSEANLLKHRQRALKRFQLFIELSLPLNYNGGKEAPLTILVRKLQNALASLERFPVVLSHAPRSRISAGLSVLSRPLKLRLCRAQGEKYLRDHSSIILLIDPLANFASVEEFLWPRIQPAQRSSATVITSDSGAGQPSTTALSSSQIVSARVASECRPSTRSRSSTIVGSASAKDLVCTIASSSKAKGKSVSERVDDDLSGPRTRNSIRRRAALDRASQVSDEDQDLGVDPVEVDEPVTMEEDGISDDVEDGDEDDEGHDEMFVEEPASVWRVHDVELGDAVDAGTVASTSATTAALSSGSGKVAGGSRGIQTLPVPDSDNVRPRLKFFMGGKQLNRLSTLYQAIKRHVTVDVDDARYAGSDFSPSDGGRLWDEVHNITYQRADAPTERDGTGTPICSIPSSSSSEISRQSVSFLDSVLRKKLPCDLEKSDCTYDILLLLRVVEGLNRLAPRLRAQGATDAFAEGKITSLDDLRINGPLVPQEEFLCSKLTPKMARQMQDALALCSGGLPSWCHQLTKACPFLFPFETRRQYFYSTSFGLARALQRLQQQQSAENPNLTNDRERRVGRLKRQKVRVSRKRILESAIKVMEMYSGQKTVLEVEYFGEVGTGLGPTLEFYTLISHELQRSALGMWRTSAFPVDYVMERDVEMLDVGELDLSPPAKKQNQGNTVRNGEFVQPSLGLFPRPYPPNIDSSSRSQFSKVIDYFRLLGQVTAKALQDGRLLDLPFSTAFYKLVLGQELDLHDIRSFDLELGTTLQEMQALVRRKQVLESMSGGKRDAISELHYRGERIEDLCLDFTLPGYSDYALKPGGNDIEVNIGNMEEYVSLVVDATTKSGIEPQMEAFRSGFNQVFGLTSLQVFAENELESLLCGVCDLWTAETIADHLKFDHGYTAHSPPILNLLEIMIEFTPAQQQAFLQFVTGSPRLPPGGLATLNPKLTIVRKNSVVNGGLDAAVMTQAVDADLPSVMTCANYLKLPPYSCKEVMRDRLLYAITEGQGSFDLS